MRKTLYFVLAVLTAGFVMTSCDEKPVTTPGDLEAPEIIMSSPEVLPVGSYNFISSVDSFNVDIRFEDDIALSDYEITIRFMPELNFLRTTNDPWKETYFGNLEGTVDGVNFLVNVVFNPTAGPYEFLVKVRDEAGKETQQATYLFVKNVQDSVPPIVDILLPNTSFVDTFAIGDDIQIRANCQDPGGLVADVRVRIRDAFTDATIEGTDHQWDTVFVNSYLADTMFTIPAGTVPGDYRVEVYATDQFYNVGLGTDMIYIKPN